MMSQDGLLALWRTPRAPDAPRQVWRDWALVGLACMALAIEFAVREELVWPRFSLPFSVVAVVGLLRRRSQPLVIAVLSFACQTVTDVAEIFGAPDTAVMYSTIVVLILPYALARWGSGREVVLGLGFILVTHMFREAVRGTPIVETVLQTMFWLVPAALGASARLSTSWRERERVRVREGERQQLARDLHDTVAHHVSAMAIQAEGGLAHAEASPPSIEGSADALRAIAAEASKSLTEMRRLVTVLRSDESSDASAHGLADVRLLARDGGNGPEVKVEICDEVNTVAPSVGVALYRIAQESVTNSLRHGNSVQTITVTVTADSDEIQLRILDNGIGLRPETRPSGYGIVGMVERAELLGGTLNAGPSPKQGWLVEAHLPRLRTTR